MTTEWFGAGDVLRSSGSEAVFLVIDPGTATSKPSVNGREMFRGSRQPCSTAADRVVSCDLQGGQRYADHLTGLKLLCIRPGRGPLSYEGRLMTPTAMPATTAEQRQEIGREEAV